MKLGGRVMHLRLHSGLFAAGDLAFLMVIGAATNATMVFVHSLEWNCTSTLIVGMIAAMVVQMILATLAAPLLGSIETMVPSMIVGMLAPMQICALEPLVGRLTYESASALGAACGAAVLITLSIWGKHVRRYLIGPVDEWTR